MLAPLQKLPKNMGDLGKLIVDKDIKKLPKVQKIGQSGNTASPNLGRKSKIVYGRRFVPFVFESSFCQFIYWPVVVVGQFWWNSRKFR